MGDLNNNNVATPMKIVGGDEIHAADVELVGGVRRLKTDAVVTVEQIFGKSAFADSWFRVENTGILNDTIEIVIAATTNDPSTPDRDAAAYSKTFTITAPEVGDELAIRDRMVTELNADAAFKTDSGLKASKVKDNAIIHISSKFRGEFWDRPNASDFAVNVTGTALITLGFDTLVTRGKATEMQESPDDPRQGILNFAGNVNITPGSLSESFDEFATDGGSELMSVNGTLGVPVEYLFGPTVGKDTFITEMRLNALDSGIKENNFLGKNTPLTNGIEVEIKADDVISFLPVMYTTNDLEDLFAVGDNSKSTLILAPGSDKFSAVRNLGFSFPIRATGTFATDDYVKFRVRDSLASITLLRAIMVGFRRDV